MSVSGYILEPIREDDEFVLYRGRGRGTRTDKPVVLVLKPAAARPRLQSLNKLKHEYSLRDELLSEWAIRPLSLSQDDNGQATLVFEYPGGEPLDRLVVGPMEMGQFLRISVGLATALMGLHKGGLIHKDLKPANVIVNPATFRVWLTGFGIASRLPRERQSPQPPEFIAGSLPYMAPEQTGRMNRSIDSRSDLYALGVTLYEMLTGSLPFTASDPMEWVHCHLARQPTPPGERLKGVPDSVSAIIMKLLAKTAEERYQTAAGAESDLRLCLAKWEAKGDIDRFALGEHDTPDKLLIPEKLYGRAREIETLLAAFDRVVAGGQAELVLVSGYSGIGKSSVVNELHKPLVPPRGLFASGKFDQYKRDIPYATLAQAFQSLIRPLLSKSEPELSKWRAALREALDPNGLLMVDLVPELKFIIGEQPPIPELPPQDAQSRFQFVFRRFISVFARQEHPLALFLDDLQWLDAATLDLLEDLLTRRDVQRLLLIGAYRDNEVNSAHPLMRKLEVIRQAGSIVQDIALAPLTREDLGLLLEDALRCKPERVAPLAHLVHEKTAGNPFFVIQFISALAEEGLLTFDHGEGRWSWDLNRIHAKRYTDNVVDLMVGKLNRLPVATQNALETLACLGNSAQFATLRIVYEDSIDQMHADLWEAARAGLIFRMEDSYTFLHDRVQEAAYSLIPEEMRAQAHLRIGRLMSTEIPPEKLEERIFEVVSQFNPASDLITSVEERQRVAELNLIAAKRAKNAIAYAEALKYLAASRAMLTEASWGQRYELIFSIEYLTAECELLTADMESAERRLSTLASHANTANDLALITSLQLTLYTAWDRLDQGIEICLDYLRRDGMNWSAHPTGEEVQREYDRIWSLLGNRQIENLIDGPLVTDPNILDVFEVLTELITPAVFFDQNLCAFVIFRLVNLSLECGNCDASCFAYVWFGIIAGPRFGNYEAGFRFGQLGYDLLGKRGLKRYEARTCLCFSVVIPLAKHARYSRDLLRHAFAIAYRMGDFTYAAYSFLQLVTNFLFLGDPLAETQAEAEKGIEFAKSARMGHVVDILAADLQLIATLRGLTNRFGTFNDKEFDEVVFERHLAGNPALAIAGFGYWTLKAEARFFAGDYASALDASSNAQLLSWAAPALLESAVFRVFGALSHAAVWDSASPDERQEHFLALTTHQRDLEIWAEHSPANFENRAALVGAEIARIEGRDVDAMRLYEKAIRSAHMHGFIHNEAVSYEVAGRFYAARGFEKIADAYLREARYGYLRWGADGKVSQLDHLYPHLKEEKSNAGPANTIMSPVELLDLATVIKVSQAVSGEMVLEKLIDGLMRAAIEHAGAERGLLIIPRGDELQIQADATTSEKGVTVRLRDASFTPAALPESIVRYVIRTQENVVIDDASSGNPFSTDPYIVQHRPRSILCVPLINQTKLTGVLYLENNLTPHVFTPDRTVVLKVLASQAAISLENTRLYRDLANREAKIQRLVDGNVMGILIWNFEGEIIEANEAFLKMVEYDREDLVKGRVRWTDLTPAEWRDRDARALNDLKQAGTAQPYEKEFFRKQGNRVPVLVGGALFEEGGNEGVAFVLDLTEQKRAEKALRRSEAYLSEAQKLSHTGSCGWNVSSGELVWSEETYRIVGILAATKPTLELVWQIVHPEDRDIVQRAIDDAARISADIDSEHRIVMSDGSIKDVHLVMRPVKNQDGNLEYIGALTDVTATKNAFRQIEGLKDQLQRENVALREEVDAASMFEEIVGTSPPLREVLSRVSKVAPTESTVLITGETGTGKELIARAIHKRSARAKQAFVSVNCAAIPPSLIHSELFGHERGAFTGALQRKLGRFELARGGTLFLDEVGEIPPETQVALLRVLQENEFERVGGTQSIKADVRLITATNRDLKQAISSGVFRSDLFYRLNVFPIEVPPLRKRKDDIPVLTEYFIHRFAGRMGKKISGISRTTLELFQCYHWPGNIRELQNIIERSLILCGTKTFSEDASWLVAEPPVAKSGVHSLSRRLPVDEKAMIEAALAETHGRVSGPSGAAIKLGLPASTLESKIRGLKINKHQFKAPADNSLKPSPFRSAPAST